jgi:hypothetical protein
MATRFYFSETLVSSITPPAPVGAAEWEHVNTLIRSMVTTADASSLTTTSYAPDAADDITNRDSCHRQYVSDPLGAQTITGNVTGQFQCLEAHANNNLFLTIKIMLCSTTGSTSRATVLAITRATSLELGTALANRTFPATAVTSTVVTPGDRLVVEIGLGGNITTAAGGVQGHNGSLRFGGSAAGGDLAVNETETGTTFRPWFEFAANLVWYAPNALLAPPLQGRI